MLPPAVCSCFHNVQKKLNMSAVEQDPVELMLKKTGCIELHYKVQECIAESGDWRMCQDKVKEFKACMQKKLLSTSLAAETSTKLVLIVRSDLKMGKGKTAAQCAHAAVMCYQNAAQGTEEQNAILKRWCCMGQPKIVLRVNSCEQLNGLQLKAEQANVVAALVRDAGRTQLDAGTATVLGLGPAMSIDLDKLIGHLKLL